MAQLLLPVHTSWHGERGSTQCYVRVIFVSFNFPILSINPFSLRWAGGMQGCLNTVEVNETKYFNRVESN